MHYHPLLRAARLLRQSESRNARKPPGTAEPGEAVGKCWWRQGRPLTRLSQHSPTNNGHHAQAQNREAAAWLHTLPKSLIRERLNDSPQAIRLGAMRVTFAPIF
jgi:hypothetical protein